MLESELENAKVNNYKIVNKKDSLNPLETLDFIHLIISKEDIHSLDKLKECLKLIAQSNPELVNNHEYIELMDL